MDTKKVENKKIDKKIIIKTFGSSPYFQFHGDYFYRRQTIYK